MRRDLLSKSFRRYIRKTLAEEVPPILQEANFAFEKGEYGGTCAADPLSGVRRGCPTRRGRMAG